MDGLLASKIKIEKINDFKKHKNKIIQYLKKYEKKFKLFFENYSNKNDKKLLGYLITHINKQGPLLSVSFHFKKEKKEWVIFQAKLDDPDGFLYYEYYGKEDKIYEKKRGKKVNLIIKILKDLEKIEEIISTSKIKIEKEQIEGLRKYKNEYIEYFKKYNKKFKLFKFNSKEYIPLEDGNYSKYKTGRALSTYYVTHISRKGPLLSINFTFAKEKREWVLINIQLDDSSGYFYYEH